MTKTIIERMSNKPVKPLTLIGAAQVAVFAAIMGGIIGMFSPEGGMMIFAVFMGLMVIKMFLHATGHCEYDTDRRPIDDNQERV